MTYPDYAHWRDTRLAGTPDVTVVIPATSKPKHLLDNMGAGRGRMPGPDLRERMVKQFT